MKQHLGLLDKLVKERFNNYENIKKCRCPTLFLHGEKDNLISYQQSLILKGIFIVKKWLALREKEIKFNN